MDNSLENIFPRRNAKGRKEDLSRFFACLGGNFHSLRVSHQLLNISYEKNEKRVGA